MLDQNEVFEGAHSHAVLVPQRLGWDPLQARARGAHRRSVLESVALQQQARREAGPAVGTHLGLLYEDPGDEEADDLLLSARGQGLLLVEERVGAQHLQHRLALPARVVVASQDIGCDALAHSGHAQDDVPHQRLGVGPPLLVPATGNEAREHVRADGRDPQHGAAVDVKVPARQEERPHLLAHLAPQALVAHHQIAQRSERRTGLLSRLLLLVRLSHVDNHQLLHHQRDKVLLHKHHGLFCLACFATGYLRHIKSRDSSLLFTHSTCCASTC